MGGLVNNERTNGAHGAAHTPPVKPSTARSSEFPAWFSFFGGFMGAGGRLPKARRGRVFRAVHHQHATSATGGATCNDEGPAGFTADWNIDFI